MCPNCRAFITSDDKICPYCQAQVGARVIDQRLPSDVLGGLIPLSLVTFRAARGRYSRNFHPGIRYVTFYWHFLDIIWLILFCVIYF